MTTIELIFSKLEEKNLTGVELCASLGLTKQTIYNWKGGMSRTYMKMLPEIAKYLGVSVEELEAAADDKEQKAVSSKPRGRAVKKQENTTPKGKLSGESKVMSQILDAMQEKKISPMAFCSDLNISKQVLYNWKKGISLSYMKMLPELAEYLELSVDDLKAEAVEEELAMMTAGGKGAGAAKETAATGSILNEVNSIFPSLSVEAQNLLLYMAKMMSKVTA